MSNLSSLYIITPFVEAVDAIKRNFSKCSVYKIDSNPQGVVNDPRDYIQDRIDSIGIVPHNIIIICVVKTYKYYCSICPISDKGGFSENNDVNVAITDAKKQCEFRWPV